MLKKLLWVYLKAYTSYNHPVVFYANFNNIYKGMKKWNIKLITRNLNLLQF